MTGIGKFVVLVILSVFDLSKSLVKLPSVEDNDILKTEVAIRTTLNNLLSLVQLRGTPENSKIKQYTTVHNFFVSETLQDYDTLKEIAKLTRVDKSTSQNVTTDFIAVLDEAISSNYFSNPSSPNAQDLTNLEDEIQRLQSMKHLYASPQQYSKINKEVLKILEHTDDKINNATEKGKALNDKENQVLNDLENIEELLQNSDTWIPSVSDSSHNKTRRIYEGKLAHEKHFPFVASVEIFKKFHCGASIIKSDLLVTAASCLQLAWNNRYYRENPLFLQVRVGSKFIQISGEAIPIMEIYFYPTYNPKTLQHNIAVMRTIRHMNFRDKSNYKVKRIELDTKNHRMPESVEILVLGWGAHTSNNLIHTPLEAKLRKYYVPVYGLEECQEVYTSKYVSKTNFCAGYISGGTGGACNRDAGGPGVFNGYLVGVISFGSPICGAPDTPTVFTKVGHYHEWIEGIASMEAPVSMKRTTVTKKNVFTQTFITSPLHYPTTAIVNKTDYHWSITPMSDHIYDSEPPTNDYTIDLTTENVPELYENTAQTPVTYPPTTVQPDSTKLVIRQGLSYSFTITTKEASYNLKQTTDDLDYYSSNKNENEHEKAKINIPIEKEKPKKQSKEDQLILFKRFLKSIFENEEEVREYLNLLNMSDVYHNESGLNMVQDLLKTPNIGDDTELMQNDNNFNNKKTDDIRTGQVEETNDSKQSKSLVESFESRFENAKGTIKYYEDEAVNNSGSFLESEELGINSIQKSTESIENGLRTPKTTTKMDIQPGILSDMIGEAQDKIYEDYSKMPSRHYKIENKILESTSQATTKYIRTSKTLAKFYEKTSKVDENKSESNETSETSESESNGIESISPTYETKTSNIISKSYTKKRKITKSMQKRKVTPIQTTSSSEDVSDFVKRGKSPSKSETVSPFYTTQYDQIKILRNFIKKSKKENWAKEMQKYVNFPDSESKTGDQYNKKQTSKSNNKKRNERIVGKEGVYEFDAAMEMPTTQYDESSIFSVYFKNSASLQKTTELPKIKTYNKIKKFLTSRSTDSYKIKKNEISPYLKVFSDDSLVNVLDEVANKKGNPRQSIEEQNNFFDQAAKEEFISKRGAVENKVGIEKTANRDQSAKYESGFKQILFDIVEKVFDGSELKIV